MSIEIRVRRFYTGNDDEQVIPAATFLIPNAAVDDFKLQPIMESLGLMAKSIPTDLIDGIREMTDDEVKQVILDEYTDSPASEGEDEDEDEIFED